MMSDFKKGFIQALKSTAALLVVSCPGTTLHLALLSREQTVWLFICCTKTPRQKPQAYISSRATTFCYIWYLFTICKICTI